MGRKKKSEQMEEFLEDLPEKVPTPPGYGKLDHIERLELAEERDRRRKDNEVITVRYEGDHPKRMLDGMSSDEIRAYVAERLLKGETAHEIAADLGTTASEILKNQRGLVMEMRLQRIESHMLTNVLRKKGPILKAISGMSLVALAEWVFDFVESGKHRDMKVGEAVQFMKLTMDINQLRRLETGKVTQRTEVIQKTQKRVDDIIETLSSANIEEGGDPFRDYGKNGQGEQI